MIHKTNNGGHIYWFRQIQIKWQSIWVLVVLTSSFLLIMTGCFKHDEITPTQSPVTYFPVQKEVLSVYPALGVIGVLVLENGTLRIKARYEPDIPTTLLVWAYGYSYRVEGEIILLYDNDGRLVARTGDTIVVGGGEMPVETIERLAAPSIPGNVPGPYWLASPDIMNETMDLEKSRERLGLPEPE